MARAIRIHRTRAPANEAARLLAEAIAAADARRGAARLAVPGGSALAALGPARARLAPEVWVRLRLTWVDERCVPVAHPDSNRGAARRLGLLDPRRPPGFELPLFLDGESPAEAVRRVEEGMRRDFESGIDVLLLGLGEDGHVASLFPGHPALGATGLATAISDSPKPPGERVSLTLPALATAAVALVFAVGEAKRPALERLLGGDPALPASRLRGLVLITDLEIEGS